MTTHHNFSDDLEQASSRAAVESARPDRVFVPLATEPFRWFASGRKRWELRRLGRQYTPKHLVPGRRVELRRGYSNKNTALWGTLAEIREAKNIARFFDDVDFRHVIPDASDREDAVRTATQILGDDETPVIGFRVEVDPVAELPLHPDFMPLVREGKKRSTVRKGVRRIESSLVDLIAGSERLRVLVTDLDVKPFRLLLAADARRDGFETLAELEAALRHFYPNISQSDPVTIIGFTPILGKRSPDQLVFSSFDVK
jgi:hypothetical protein